MKHIALFIAGAIIHTLSWSLITVWFADGVDVFVYAFLCWLVFAGIIAIITLAFITCTALGRDYYALHQEIHNEAA